MGAVVTIIDHVSSASDAASKMDEIVNRSEIVRDRCFGCLIAVHVDNPTSLSSFNDTAGAIATDPNIKSGKLLDLITYDYQISNHASVGAGGATAIADDITAYGRASLQAGWNPLLNQSAGLPTMVVGLNVENNDGTWSNSNFKDLFETIVEKQGEMVKAGVLGIIYSPVRGSAGSSNTGLVDVTGGVGAKTAKFCAFQGAMYKMSTIPPNAMFTRVAGLNTTSCVLCNSLDKVQGLCGAPGGHSAPICDNGVECDLPGGANVTDYKCPDQTIVGSCTLCKDVPGYYHCVKSYANGTVEYPNGSMTDVSSDIYLDVIGGIAKPNKCCLEAPGTNGTYAPYTYEKQSFSTPQNQPLVFPRSGDPNVDCGFGSSIDAVNQLSNFCNVQTVPLKNFDISCNVTNSP
jgi:hypothetical protein